MKNNKEKIELMITDLLVKIHQNMATGEVRMTDVELLGQLEEMLKFRIKYQEKQ